MRRGTSKKTYGLLQMFLFLQVVTVLGNAAASGLTVWVLIRHGLLFVSSDFSVDVSRLILFYALISVPTGLLISLMMVRFPLRPVWDLIDSMNRLGSGDFKTRIHVGAIMRRYSPFVAVADSFNKMAEQLESTEMLRSDFINNFSHEFKTPIVSIAGFAKLLRRGNLPPEEQQEDLRIIEEESIRLSLLATNVLNLTKVENQTILTDVTCYNLSEQLRSCILLLESKWNKKDLDLELDFAEYSIEASAELMKQVWINLLDNAIKFAPDGHTVRVEICSHTDALQVRVSNTGSEIPPDKQEKIFRKFYQADESHKREGNGVGLAIVKRIVELHSGSVSVESGHEVTTFTVLLPKRQE